VSEPGEPGAAGDAGEPARSRPVEVRSGGEPTPEEVAAIVAAIEVAWPRSDDTSRPATAPRWRFSGRWWSKPVPLRRTRPGAW
jgi:hypothetical protein